MVISGVPTKSYKLPTEWIQPNTTVVNVASFKNVDEASLLQIEGVQYVPMVGKVTVAMLERNLMRLYENFHHPDRRLKSAAPTTMTTATASSSGESNESPNKTTPMSWLVGNGLQLYTAVVATGILALLVRNNQRK